MKILELYNIEGKKITPRNGQKIERGFALDEAREWVEINQPATVKIWNEWDNQSQSSDKGMALIFDEPEKEEPVIAEDKEPVIAEAEETEVSWETRKLEKENALIAELKAMKFTQNEIVHGLKKAKSEYRLNDNGERIAYMVDAILALRAGWNFVKLGDAKNLQALRKIRTEEMPLTVAEKEKEAARIAELDRKLKATEIFEAEAVKKAAKEFIESSVFCDTVRENAIWIEGKSYQTAATVSRSDADGDNQTYDLGYNKWVHEPAHYDARKTIWKMIENEIMPRSFFDHVFSRIEEICEQLTKEKENESH